MKLVTFNGGSVGHVEEDGVVVELGVHSMREYFEGGQVARPTGRTF